MQINAAGQALIKKWEGLRFVAYDDGFGRYTIGWGHTGPDVIEGLKIDQAKAEQLFADDLCRIENVLDHTLSVPVNENQYSACGALAFNIGVGAWQYRCSIASRLKMGDLIGAAETFEKWDTVNGIPVRGLLARRKEERALFETPVTP